MILALTGAGISKPSGIPTFADQPGLRDCLTRRFAIRNPNEFQDVIKTMQEACENAEPNDAHKALAEYNVPIITMNVDGLHQKAGSKHVLPIHGNLPNPVLYGDPAPLYQDAHNWVFQLQPGDFFLIIGTSHYTNISTQLKISALGQGADIYEINEDAEHQVRNFLERAKTTPCTFEEFIAREPSCEPLKPPYT